MRTLIVSDLHFGSASGADVLRLPEVRRSLIEALDGVGRLVLLGDVLELRHGPRRGALDAAKPFFQELGAAMSDGEIVIAAGNHDHALVDGWLQRRAELSESPPLRLQQVLRPEQASPMAQTLAGWAAPARVTVAHPGFWVREDVYAIHGHYLDCHITVPTIERIAVAAMGRMLGISQQAIRGVADYEALTAPIYAWVDAVAAQGATRAVLNGSATMRMWRALAEERPRGGGGAPAGSLGAGGSGREGWRTAAARRLRREELARTLRREAVRKGFPVAVSALNRLGLGPVGPDISAQELRRAGLAAMGEVAARLGLDGAYVVFGHTHRAGPLPGDAESEWRGRTGARLLNTGSWVYSPGFVMSDAGRNPYWPGGCVVVDEAGPPSVGRLLADRSRRELTGAQAAR